MKPESMLISPHPRGLAQCPRQSRSCKRTPVGEGQENGQNEPAAVSFQWPPADTSPGQATLCASIAVFTRLPGLEEAKGEEKSIMQKKR